MCCCRLVDALATARDRIAFIFFGRRLLFVLGVVPSIVRVDVDDVSFGVSVRILFTVLVVVGSLLLDGGVSLPGVVARNNDEDFNNGS